MRHTETSGSGWQLQGNAAAAYETYLVPAIFDAMGRRLVTTAAVQPGDRVLDLACGTGVVARVAARRVGPTGAVAAVDVNADMLAVAETAAADVAPPIDWRQADAAALPFDDDAFDVVLCQEAMQFFGDRVAVLREMRRVAKPGGRVAFSVLRSLKHNPVYQVVAQALREHTGAAAEQMMGSPFALGDGETLRAAARKAELTDVVIRIAIGEERFPSVPEFVLQEAASSPLAAPLGELEEARRTALIEALERQLATHRDDTGLVFHNETHIVTSRA